MVGLEVRIRPAFIAIVAQKQEAEISVPNHGAG